MRENIVMVKAYAFALRIVKAYKFLYQDQHEFVMSKQLLRSGTAIGALIKESEHAQSKADFINKMNVALKEANETEYWLMLLHDSDFMNDNVFTSIITDCREIVRLLISIVRSSKENNIR
ncbi:four helix bundle protein [Paludibacter sp.]|uniref:four helix bundle protein n=1 Tax=Paludibacter sp. TaxID=1898105 RepID=UPI001354AB58|nr:four helix bundle protein [Paludibacter sp.]MTK53075.1 four helix bundle protein [Paludibacter sp.]